MDLLGLESVPPGPTSSAGGLNFLVDVFGDQPTTNGIDLFGSGLTPGAEENYRKYEPEYICLTAFECNLELYVCDMYDVLDNSELL